MIEILESVTSLLAEAGYSTSRARLSSRDVLLFENATVLGFVFAYEGANSLAENWASDSERAIAGYQLPLRRAAQKAWNTYVVLLATGEVGQTDLALFASVEEDLVGTRKIARGDIVDMSDLRSALLPLLPIQSAPKLEAVDMVAEIRERTSEISSQAVAAFVSTAPESTVVQILEEAP